MHLEPVDSCPLCGGEAILAARLPSGLWQGYDHVLSHLGYDPGGAPAEWTLDRCRTCGFVFTNPRIPAADLGRCYSDAKYREAPDPIPKYMQDLARRVAEHVPSGRWLDVGFGTGEMLRAATEMGYEPHGVEPCAAAVDFVRRHFGFQHVHCGLVEELNLPTGAFDVVSALDVLEHVPGPAAFLEAVARLLRPGGIFLIQVMDAGAPLFRLWPSRWYYSQPAVHLGYYTASTLRAALDARGFQVIHCGRYGRGLHVLKLAVQELRRWAWRCDLAGRPLLGPASRVAERLLRVPVHRSLLTHPRSPLDHATGQHWDLMVVLASRSAQP